MEPEPPEDEEEWAKRAASDPAAFEAIYDRYLTGVYRYICRRVGDPAEAEDLTSLVFLRVLEGLRKGQFSPRSSLAAWLFAIARARIADYYRQRKAVPLSEGAALVDEATWNDETDLLSQNFSRLSHSEQELLALRFSADLDFKTMGAMLHKPPAAVKMATYRALRNLRKKMEETDETKAAPGI